MSRDGVKAEEKTKFIILTGLHDRRHSMPPTTTWEDTGVARRQVARVRGRSKSWPLSGFPQKREDRARSVVYNWLV